MDAPDIAAAWSAAVNAGRQADRNLFAQTFEVFRRQALVARRDEDLFRKSWRSLAESAFECGEIDQGLADIHRALSDNLVSRASMPLLSQIEEIAVEHAEVFQRTRRFVSQASEGRIPDDQSDLQIVGWLRFLDPASNRPLDALRIWIVTTAAAMSLARRRGLVCTLLPDYLSGLDRNAAPRVLSFHTCGIAEGLVHYKPADLPGYVVIDKGGYSGWSSIADSGIDELPLAPLPEATAFFDLHRREIIDRNLSKYDQPPPDAAPLPERYVFVPLQVILDRTQRLARVAMLDMLDMIAQRFRDTATRVVVKRHPKCLSEQVAAHIDRLQAEGAIVVRDDSIHRLIAGADAVMTVNSGVGSEAIVHLKPIYLFGKADYGAVAFSIATFADLVEQTEPIRPRVDADDMKRFLHFYRTKYLVRIDDRERLENVLIDRLLS